MIVQATPKPVSAPVAERVPPRTTGRIETDRLSLTAVKSSDLDAVMCIYGHAQSARMTHAVPWPLTREGAKALLDDLMDGDGTHWAIRLPDGRMAGVVSLSGSACGKGDGIHSFGPNLSVFVDPAFQGRGFAQESIEGLLRHARREGRHRVVHAAHFADNEASARTLVYAGFLYTGRRTLETSRAREGEHQALHMIRIL